MSQRVDWITVSGHAAERWHERTDEPGIGPIVAWNEAERRHVPDLDAEEIRYHRPTETLLLQNGGVLVTVINVSTARKQVQQAVKV